MKSKCVIADGNELRGFRFKVYPTREQEVLLRRLERDLRIAWNWLVDRFEHVLRSREDYAVTRGLVGPRPIRPNYDGLEPEEAATTKEQHRDAVIEWSKAVKSATDDVPDLAYSQAGIRRWIEHCGVRHDYQVLSRVIDASYPDATERPIRPGAFLLQALARNFQTYARGQRRKRRRRPIDSMPIQVRSGDCFRVGDFGDRRGAPGYYSCQVTINGLKIRGRLPGRAPWGRVIEGVSLVREPDGWWASIKQEVPKRELPAPSPGSMVGIDVGLDMLAAMSDGRRVANPRGKELSLVIAQRQSEKKPVGRLQARLARQTKHTIYSRVIKPLETTETILIEDLGSRIGQMGSRKVSAMRTVASMLKERYGDRVREVPPHYTSQECSKCGHRSKESWSYEHGRFGECPACGHRQDRDVNAARNLVRKHLELQATKTDL